MDRMKTGRRARGRLCLVLSAVLLTVFLGTPVLTVRAEAGPADRRVPYMFFIDDLMGKGSASGDERPRVDSDWAMEFGQTVTFSGWLAVGEGVDHYEYAFVPAGETVPVWEKCEDAVISARPDLAKAGIPYQTGHATAGFTLTVTVPASADGYYDFYLRGVSGDDVFCDLLIVVNAAVGLPDADDGRTHTVNMNRLARDAKSLTGCVFSDDGSVLLSAEGLLSIGVHDLGLYEAMEIEYTAEESLTLEKDGDRAILGIKSAPGSSRAGTRPDPYRMSDTRYDLTDNVGYGTITAGTKVVSLDLSQTDVTGELFLSAYLFGADTVRVRSVSFVYAGCGADRAAVKLYFSGDLIPYFYTPNGTTTEVVNVHDPVMGDVLRVRAAEDTNDAYIHFGFESLLDTKNFKLSADDYKYMVILCRARKGNRGDRMTFYLCPGAIGGPTEACTKSCTLACDDQWHYVILDLHTPDTWRGIIHLWRFDMINGNSAAGDYVDYATIQFFRTEEAAKAAASASLKKPTDPYICGGDPVLLDMSEEEALASSDQEFVPAAARVYVYEEPATEPLTVPDTEPVSEPVTAPETRSDTGAETDVPPSGGCRSAANAAPLMLWPAALIVFASRKKSDRSEKRT